MTSLASMGLVGRSLKRGLARATVAVTSTSSSSSASAIVPPNRCVHLLAAHQLGDESTSKVPVLIGVAALAVASAIGIRDTAHCETLAKDNKATHSPVRSAYFDEDYEPCQLVGSGSFGMVMQCVNKRDGRVAAVKMIQDVNDIREEVARETDALERVQCAGGHANIVRYDGRYGHDGFHYIVTEFVEGESLYEYVEKRRQLDVVTALQLTTQLASALAFLRAQHLIHRDLKPANLMVQRATTEAPLQLKIIDFGSAEYYVDETPSKPTQPRAMVLSGTRCYWPPEVLERQATSPAMDMWALGCILYIMIAGRHPFDMMGSSSEDEIVHRVATDKVSFLHPVWSNVPCAVKSLIRGLLEKDPSVRLSVDEVLAHPALRASL